MRKIGKIVDFDGYSGELVDKEGTRHVFTKDDLMSEGVNVEDIVYFDSQLFKTVEVEMFLAKFIKKK